MIILLGSYYHHSPHRLRDILDNLSFPYCKGGRHGALQILPFVLAIGQTLRRPREPQDAGAQRPSGCLGADLACRRDPTTGLDSTLVACWRRRASRFFAALA